jgi:hypothetical protein
MSRFAWAKTIAQNGRTILGLIKEGFGVRRAALHHPPSQSSANQIMN